MVDTDASLSPSYINIGTSRVVRVCFVIGQCGIEMVFTFRYLDSDLKHGLVQELVLQTTTGTGKTDVPNSEP